MTDTTRITIDTRVLDRQNNHTFRTPDHPRTDISKFRPSTSVQNCINAPHEDKDKDPMGSNVSQKSKANLPSFLLTNLRGFGKSGESDKHEDLDTVLDLNNVDVAVLTETWTTEDSLNELVFDRYTMFHSVRTNCIRASGGVSIFVKTQIQAVKLNVDIPKHLEVMYISICPSWLPRSISNIIICGVYYPGSGSEYAPPQEDLVSHLTESIHRFYNKYACPLIMIMGDFNDMNITELCELCSLKQVVKVPTRENAILDLIMTNCHNDWYNDPIGLPKIGKSDHFCVLYVPKQYVKPKNSKEKIMVRQFKKSAILDFGSWLVNYDWSPLFEIFDVDLKSAYFSTITWLMIDKFFPLIMIEISSTDKEWITPNLKKLINQRQQAFLANNMDLYKHLARKVRLEIRKAKLCYNKKKAHLFHTLNPREWYKHIYKIIGNKKQNLNIINIPDLENKTIDEQTKIVNDHFSNICKKYPPLKNFQISTNEVEAEIECVTEMWTYKMILKYAKKSLGHDDFPHRILKEFAPELATPFCDIINCALKTGIFPAAYKKAEIVPIPKINPPRSLSDLRPISKTPIGGKMIEKALMSELEKDIEGKLDNTQYGNCKGSSTTHYLVKLMDQAYSSTDRRHAATAITIDYSKAFDYVDHNVLMQKLLQLGVRKKVIKLIASFLTDRSHTTIMSGKKSEFVKITCGVPQGTVMGPKLFVILINGDKCSSVTNYKFVDDKTLILCYEGNPTKILQDALDIELRETKKDQMIINESKCHSITFNFCSNNIPPQNLMLNGNVINSTNKIKLLGVILTDDLKWAENTSNICSKVRKKLYLINKLKHFGLLKEELLTAWTSILRPVTEYAVPLWHSGLTDSDSNKIEMLQKQALSIIFGTTYVDFKKHYKVGHSVVSYEDALKLIGLTTLDYRREVLTNKFALDLVENPKHNDLFIINKNNYMATRNKLFFKEPFCHTDRYYKSAIPYMTRYLNQKL